MKHAVSRMDGGPRGGLTGATGAVQVEARRLMSRRSHPLVRLVESAGPRRGANARDSWPVVPAGSPPLSWGGASSVSS